MPALEGGGGGNLMGDTPIFIALFATLVLFWLGGLLLVCGVLGLLAGGALLAGRKSGRTLALI
jgi:hypothetical protein